MHGQIITLRFSLPNGEMSVLHVLLSTLFFIRKSPYISTFLKYIHGNLSFVRVSLCHFTQKHMEMFCYIMTALRKKEEQPGDCSS